MTVVATSKPSVFISFSFDDMAVVKPIVDLLEKLFASDVEFFLAPRHVNLGVNWVHDIENELRAARCVLALVSDAAAVSRWVLFEAGIAYGLGIPFIPLGISGYRIERQHSPLAFLQGANLKSAADLNDVVDRLASSLRVTRPRSVTAAEFGDLFENVIADAPPLQARSLLTRPAIYAKLRTLIDDCHFNAEVRAVTTIHSDDFDDHFTQFLATTVKKCGAALRNGGRMYYRAVFGFDRPDGAIPEFVRRSLAKRLAAFANADALPAAKFFETRRAGSLDVLLLDREDAIIAFPHPDNVDQLQYGIHFTGYDLVNPLVNWFDSTVMEGVVPLRHDEFLPKLG